MGFEWHDEDPHGRSWAPPKLTLVGRLDATLAGRPLTLEGDDRNLIVDVAHIRPWLKLRRAWTPLSNHFRRWLDCFGIRLLVRFRWFGSVELLPNPPYWIGLVFPRG